MSVNLVGPQLNISLSLPAQNMFKWWQLANFFSETSMPAKDPSWLHESCRDPLGRADEANNERMGSE